MKKLSLLLLAGLLAVGFSACSSTDIIAGGLKVEVARIERAANGAVQVTWRVGNPNVVSYVVAKSTHKLTVNGTVVGTFGDETHLGVPAQTQVERTGVLVPAGPAAGSVIDQAVAQGSASYQLESVVMLLIVDDNFERVRFSASGTVPVVAK